MNVVIEVLKMLSSALLSLMMSIFYGKIRYRHQRKIEIKQRIGKPIYEVYTLIEDLIEDVERCSNEQTRIRFDKENLDWMCEKIKGALLEYGEWYNEFGRQIQLELECVDNTLLGSLKRLLRYSNLVNDSNFHIVNHLDELKQDLERCKDRIRYFHENLYQGR